MNSILELCAGLPVRAYDLGSMVLEEGGRIGLLLVLIDGDVEVLKGETRVARLAQPGAVFGEISMLLNQPHSASVRCLAPSRFHEVEDAAAFMGRHPELALHVCRLLAHRLQAMTHYLMDLKAQYEDRTDHLGMVNEVLESLLHNQRRGT